MGLIWYKKNNMHLGVLEGSPLEQELTAATGWEKGAARTPSSPDLANPELSQIPIFFETNASKDTLDKILAEYRSDTKPTAGAESGGGG